MAKQQQKIGKLSLINALSAVEVDLGVLSLINSYGKAGHEELVKITSTPTKGITPEIRARAVYVLGILRWRPAFKPLLKLLRDKSASVRLNAIYAISEVGGPNAVEPLLTIVKDAKRGATEQAHALRCLADIGDEKTLVELEAWSGKVQSIELKKLAGDMLKRLRLSLAQIQAR
jgi:HEAT repeat protein